MSTLAIRENAWLAATVKQQTILKIATQKVGLGEPAKFKTNANVIWLVWDDERIDGRDVAIIGKLAATLAQLPAGVNTRAELWDYVKSTIVLPKDVNTNGANPLQDILNANGAPNWLRADNNIPSGLTPVE